MSIENQVNKHGAPDTLVTDAQPDVANRHPRALYVLFFTEMWERFSYYGMRALLVLYLIDNARGGLGWSSAEAGSLYGTYTGLVYVTPIIGGFLADRYMGFRRAVFLGGILMMFGHVALAFEPMPAFYLGLGLLIIGNGFFKPNISSMVGQLYPEGSALKDSAYTIFYMGINLGAFLGTIICGYLGESDRFGWHYGFGAAGVGMAIGLIQFYFGQRTLGKIGLRPVKSATTATDIPKAPLTKVERDRLLVVFVLAFFSIIFWLAFEQAGSSMNIFAYKYTNRDIAFLNFTVPASWFQSVNALFIFTLAPVFSAVWVWLSRRGKNPSGPFKFAFGLVFLAAGFVALVVGAASIPVGAEAAGVSMLWLVLAYLLHTMGELCLSPVGLSAVNKLSPARLVGLMFGVWFLASAIGNKIGGLLSGLVDEMAQTRSLSFFFGIFVIVALVAAALLFAVGKPLARKMHGIE